MCVFQSHSHRGDIAFESNYCAGLRVLDISDIRSGTLNEVCNKTLSLL